MYEQILVPLDGSSFAEAALPLALSVCRKTGAGLHLVVVLEPVTSFAYEGWEAAAVEWSRSYLDDVVQRLGGQTGVEFSSEVVEGHTVERLQEECERREIDLVVMATHGRGALSKLWLGSVADGFVRQADRPVALVRPDEDAAALSSFDYDFRTLLVPLDGSELSEKAMDHAIEFGELFDAAYHLTRVVPYPIDMASPYLPHTARMNQEVVEQAREGAAEYLEAHAERLRLRGLSVTTSVAVDAQPGRGVLAEVDAVGPDVIAMATHGRSGLSRILLGSTADKVLRGSHVPLLLFRPRPEQA